jgi:glycosyltransferase involved in cell wall biosynthesis
LIERFLAQFTDAAVCITKETQDSLVKLKIGKSLKWQVIRLGIPIGNLINNSTKESSKITLLWVGRFTDIKDPFYAISVISELEDMARGKYELQMVGGGELLEKSKELSSKLPVAFTGWLDNPFESLNDFDLLLLTSKNEGMGLVMLEAARLSKATVARNVGGVTEFLVNNVNGLTVNGSPKIMAEQISKLSIEDIDKLGSAAKSELLKNFTDKRLAKEYFGLYQSLAV